MNLSKLSLMDVIDLHSGRILGQVADLEISLKDGRITAVVLEEGGGGRFFRRGSEMVIPISRIVRFGEDVILVELPGPFGPKTENEVSL